MITWERACSRRGRNILKISPNLNTAFASKLAPTGWAWSGRSRQNITASGWCLRSVGTQSSWDRPGWRSTLLAKGPEHPQNFSKPEHRFREQARSHRIICSNCGRASPHPPIILHQQVTEIDALELPVKMRTHIGVQGAGLFGRSMAQGFVQDAQQVALETGLFGKRL